MDVNEREPIFSTPTIDWKARLRALHFSPRPLVYRAVRKHIRAVRKRYASIEGGERYHPTIVVLGCAHGPDIVDLRRLIQREAEIIGVDQSQLDVDVATTFIKQYGAWAHVYYQQDDTVPLEPNTADVVFVSESYTTNDLFETMNNIALILKSGGIVVGVRDIKPGKVVFGKKRLARFDTYRSKRVYSKASYEEAIAQSNLSLDTAQCYRFVPALPFLSGLWYAGEMITIGRFKSGSALYFHATKPLKEPLQFGAKQVSYSLS